MKDQEHPPLQPWEVDATAAGLAANMNPAEPRRAAPRQETKSEDLMVGKRYATTTTVPTASSSRPPGISLLADLCPLGLRLLAGPRRLYSTVPHTPSTGGSENGESPRGGAVAGFIWYTLINSEAGIHLQDQAFGCIAAGLDIGSRRKILITGCAPIDRSCGDPLLGRQPLLRWASSSGCSRLCQDSYRLLVGECYLW